MKPWFAPPALAWFGAAHAHEGPGIPAAHWHVADAVGFVVAAVAVATVWWLGRK